MKILKALLYPMLLAPVLAIANDASDNVRVASLDVKERLRSIEQINVTAAKEKLAVEPQSSVVAELLREAAAIEAADAPAQSATH